MRGEATMEYNGYAARPIDFDPEDKTFSGPVRVDSLKARMPD